MLHYSAIQKQELLKDLIDCTRFDKKRHLVIRDINFITYMDHNAEKVGYNEINDFGRPFYHFTGKFIYSTSNDFIYPFDDDNNRIDDNNRSNYKKKKFSIFN